MLKNNGMYGGVQAILEKNFQGSDSTRKDDSTTPATGKIFAFKLLPVYCCYIRRKEHCSII